MKALRKQMFKNSCIAANLKKSIWTEILGWKEDMSGDRRMYGSKN